MSRKDERAESDSGVRRVTADGPSGFDNADALLKAEVGDGLEIDFRVLGTGPDIGQYRVVGKVVDISEQEESDRLRRRRLTIEGYPDYTGKFAVFHVSVLRDTRSAMTSICRRATYSGEDTDPWLNSARIDVDGLEVRKHV